MSGLTPVQVIEHKHAMAGMAELIRAYYDSLRKEGFSRKDSFALVIDYQREIVRGAQSE